jgi:N-acetylmuramoyl-L-alanine amidase
LAVGFGLKSGAPRVYTTETSAAVANFQASRGLVDDGICGPQTWSALVEAGHRLGDRLLYHRSPMLRGEDVSDLQRRLGALGFDAGRVDGILGPDTAGAMADFQTNAGIVSDAIFGPDTLRVLERMDRWASADAVASVRERDRLRNTRMALEGSRVIIGDIGGGAALTDAVARTLQRAGAAVDVLRHSDASTQAHTANEFQADVYIGLSLSGDERSRTAYFRIEGFESVGGRRMAELLAANLGEVLDRPSTSEGMRLPVLRETRMPAVQCLIGPADLVVRQTAQLAETIKHCVTLWFESPVEES